MSTALDEAATALTRIKSDKQNYEAFLRGASQAPSSPGLQPPPSLQHAPPAGTQEQQQQQQQQPQFVGQGDSMQTMQRLLTQGLYIVFSVAILYVPYVLHLR